MIGLGTIVNTAAVVLGGGLGLLLKNGVGAMFSAIPIFVYQGAITVIAAMFGAVISDVLIGELSFVGSALIFCVGVNLVREKTFRVANMLPALLIPIVVELWRVLAK